MIKIIDINTVVQPTAEEDVIVKSRSSNYTYCNTSSTIGAMALIVREDIALVQCHHFCSSYSDTTLSNSCIGSNIAEAEVINIKEVVAVLIKITVIGNRCRIHVFTTVIVTSPTVVCPPNISVKPLIMLLGQPPLPLLSLFHPPTFS